MIDHILGRPSPSWKRTQVASVYSILPRTIPHYLVLGILGPYFLDMEDRIRWKKTPSRSLAEIHQ
jgi:hypothetical protein